MQREGRFRRQFVIQWAVFAATMLGFAGLVAYTLYQEHVRIEAREQARLFAQARVIDENLSKQLESTDGVLLKLRDEIGAGTPAADIAEHLSVYEQAIPGIRTLVVLDAEGNAKISNRPELVGRNLSHREYFKLPREFPDSGKLFVSRPFKTVLGSWALNLTRVLIGPRGEFTGVVTATLDPQYFTTLLASVQYAPDLRSVIVHADGDIFLMVPEAQPVQGMNIAKPDSFFTRHQASGRSDSIFSGTTYATGEQRIVALRTIRAAGVPLDKPPVVVVTRDLGSIYEGWLRDVQVYVSLLVAAAILIALVMVLAQQRQRSQLRRIERADLALRDSEERYRALFQFSADAILVHPLEGEQGGLGRFVEANATALERYGYSREELLAMTPLDLDEVRTYPTPEDLAAFLAHARQAGHLIFERIHVAKDGRPIPVEVNSHIFELKGQEMMLSIVRDISERRKREEALRLAGAVFDSVDEGVLVTDANKVIVAVNSGFTAITGYAEEEVLGKDPSILSSGTNPPDFYRKMWEEIKATGAWRGEVLNRRKSGEFYVEWLSIKRLVDQGGEATHYIGVFSDISERKASEERMRYLAHYDALTDLPNRTLLEDRAAQALSRARRDKRRVGILFFDLDRFKPVNDRFGHDVGDQLLKEVAKRVLACVRESDTVARLGGDEFVVVLPEIAQTEDAVMVGNKILAALNEPFEVAGHRLEIGASIGVAVYPEHAGDEAKLVKHADEAMYQAKAAGKNTVAVWRPAAGAATA